MHTSPAVKIILSLLYLFFSPSFHDSNANTTFAYTWNLLFIIYCSALFSAGDTLIAPSGCLKPQVIPYM